MTYHVEKSEKFVGKKRMNLIQGHLAARTSTMVERGHFPITGITSGFSV